QTGEEQQATPSSAALRIATARNAPRFQLTQSLVHFRLKQFHIRQYRLVFRGHDLVGHGFHSLHARGQFPSQ
ncbi:MAG: hypothetical protein RIQ52_954, partial [Pseudomonadota bacterium]